MVWGFWARMMCSVIYRVPDDEHSSCRSREQFRRSFSKKKKHLDERFCLVWIERGI